MTSLQSNASRTGQSPSPRLTECDSSDVDAPTAQMMRKPVQLVGDTDVVALGTGSISHPATSMEPRAALEAAQIAEAFLAMPKPGDVAYGFEIVREIGSGGFGRVFLATQENLAGRYVVLKVSADLAGESRALAKLQHTNIVPVYSVHRSGPLQAVCMPYFGTTTLQNLLRRFRESDAVPATGRAFVETFRFINSGGESAILPVERPPEPTTDAVFSLLATGSYVRAVVWLMIRIADGMAHAHDRGIIHRDIKPANILLTDDGQPMLLDFGVSEELVLRATMPSPTLGGTLAYMAPEHLTEVRTKTPSADARSDIYSLGIVFFELLCGQYPFPMPTGSSDEEIERLIGCRRAGPLHSLCNRNRDVSPGLESIVLKCLAFEANNRYQSANDLREDLNRYIADRPLKFAPERSIRERIQKWKRRHPYLTSTTAIGAMIAVLFLGIAAGTWANWSRLERLEADETFREFQKLSSETRQLLFGSVDNTTTVETGIERANAAIAKYDADRDGWDRSAAVTGLPAEQQAELRRDLVDLYLMLARGHWFRAVSSTPENADEMELAVRWNARAAELAGNDPPRMVFVQRQTMFAKLGRKEQMEEAKGTLAATAPHTARDYFQTAISELDAKNYPVAIEQYRKAQRLDPKAVWAYYGEGICQLSLGQWAAARGCFSSTLALDSQAPFAYYHRGVASMRLDDAQSAIDDLTKALLSQPSFAEAYMVRAEAHERLLDYVAALEDVDAAIGLGASHRTALPVRSRLRGLTGDAAGAQADLRDPDNADGWIHRGLDKLATDKAAALAAFEKAIALNPKSANARMYQAHVYGETGREAECVNSLTKAIELDPKNVAAIASRGVMRGRLKQYKLALADARTALDMSFAPLTVYQVACIYSHVSQEDSAYRAEALALLGIALRAGFGHDYVATDRDLSAVRQSPEFEALVAKSRRDLPLPKP